MLAAALLACSGSALADEQPICADRPSKSTGPCTVPRGDWQVETGLIDWSRDKSAGARTVAVAWGNTAVKYGIGGNADVEIWITPVETLDVRTPGLRERHSSFGDTLLRERHSSFGDTLLRVKYALTPDDAPVQVALDPFVKIPTANRRLGNGKVEAGLLAPVQIALGKSPVTLSLGPELDVLADREERGRHLATQQVVNLQLAATDKLSLSTELWAMWDWDPAATAKQASWDASAAYLATPDLQLDAGANFGLNRQTPGVEVYTGFSVRF